MATSSAAAVVRGCTTSAVSLPWSLGRPKAVYQPRYLLQVRLSKRELRTRARTRRLPRPPTPSTVVVPENDEDDDEEASAPWQALLGIPARAAWRASSPHPPEKLVDTQMEILDRGQRTSKQLRRTFQRTLKAHLALADRRERERQRAKNRLSRPDSLKNKADMAQDASIKPVYYKEEQTLATLQYRLLPNYAIIKRVLMEAKSLIGPNRFKPERVIDFGIGCGGASAAALDVFDSISWIHGIDPSRSMLDSAELVLAGVLASQDGSVPSTRVTLNTSMSTGTSAAKSVASFDLAIFAYTATELPHTASTLAAAAALWEKLRPNGVLVMVEPGTPDGFNSIRSVRSMLLDCCPPSGESYKGEAGQDECHVIAPCTHNKTCPMERHRSRSASDRNPEPKEYIEVDTDDEGDEYYDEDEDSELEDDDDDDDDDNEDDFDSGKSAMAVTDAFKSSFCSFVHTMPGANHRSKGEKLSYLVAQKRIAGDPESDDELLNKRFNEFNDTNIHDLLLQLSLSHKDNASFDENVHDETTKKVVEAETRYLDSADEVGLEILRGDQNRNLFGRLIRAPIKKRGHVLVDYCGSSENSDSGRIVRHRVGRRWCAKVAPGMYRAAVKARWGGLWPDLMESTPQACGDSEDADNDAEVL